MSWQKQECLINPGGYFLIKHSLLNSNKDFKLFLHVIFSPYLRLRDDARSWESILRNLVRMVLIVFHVELFFQATVKLRGESWTVRASLGCWQALLWPYVRAWYRKPVFSTFLDELCHQRIAYITINRCVCGFVDEHKSWYMAREMNGKMKIGKKANECSRIESNTSKIWV